MNSYSDLSSYFDVIIVGSGAAGLYSTLCLPKSFKVALITKDELKKGASNWAQGGIAAAINSDDSPQLHYQDTLKAGAGLCDRQAVNFLVENASIGIESLIEMGVTFDRHNDQLAMTLEAAHSRPRVLHAADTTGKAIVSILRAKVLENPQIQVYEQASALSLWIDEKTGVCEGVCVLYDQKISWIRSKAVILATGGGGQVFAQTTNPKVSTGDGVALAWRGGAILRDLEFMQFHPTALNKADAPHFLISEAVRGEGAHLIDNLGHRFAFDYHPKGELAPRDVVSRAIFSHLQKTTNDIAHSNVFLDLRPIPIDRINYRFPNIIQKCQEWGIDIFNEPIPVSPAAHYWMGGVAVNLDNSTSIANLYAIGESANTGVHGANRLASNSLLECIVFAQQLHNLELPSGDYSPTTTTYQLIEEDWSEDIKFFETIRNELPIIIWESVGICRNQMDMDVSMAKINSWRLQLKKLNLSKYILNINPNQQYQLNSQIAEDQLKLATETLNLLDIGYLIIKSASFRQESRGGHYRLDYPDTSSNWEVHTLIQNEQIWKSSDIQ